MNELTPISFSIKPDPWQSLRAFTDARIALGKTGNAIPLKEVLALKLAHAHARDAVYSTLHTEELFQSIKTLHSPVLILKSKATNREQYLQRPDLGRQLDASSSHQLHHHANKNYDIVISIADGLSADAINKHALGVLELLIPLIEKAGYNTAPICMVEQARVAVADEIGASLNAKLSLILIGERPGLSSPDSTGAYLTYNPEFGLTDESRNCISNIRPGGLSYSLANEKIFYLIQQSMRLKISGIALKDDQHLISG